MKRLSRTEVSIQKLKDSCARLGIELLSDFEGSNIPILVRDKYGLCKAYPNALIKGIRPTVITAVDKTAYTINKFKEVHGIKYDYNLVNYVDANTYVSITCSVHGTFLQTPTNHLGGRGCSGCKRMKLVEKNRCTEKDVLKRFKDIHKKTYDYSKVSYVDMRTKVRIFCNVHGEFLQSPDTHLSGSGCPECGVVRRGISQRLTQDDFVKMSSIKHNNKYTYNNFIYTKNICRSFVTCPVHGDYLQRAADHLAGCGCNQCEVDALADRTRLTREQFIERAVDTHGDRYDYSKVVYKNTISAVTIICKYHGEFDQSASGHLGGKGCPTCGRIVSSYRNDLSISDIEASKSLPCELYVMELLDKESKDVFWKVGISKDPKKRLAKLNVESRLEAKLIFTDEDSIFECYTKEDQFLKKYKHLRYYPKFKFGGHTECFKINPTDLVKNFI